MNIATSDQSLAFKNVKYNFNWVSGKGSIL